MTITIKTDEGYALKTLIIMDKNKKPISYTDNGDGTYTFTITMPDGKVSISATFAKAERPFTDVSKDAYDYDVVLWAVDKGATNGTSVTAFAPDPACTGAQIVTFLYRQFGKRNASLQMLHRYNLRCYNQSESVEPDSL